jgi:hypothetical protein
MPFGRFRGCQIEDLPSDYLQWLTTIELRGSLREAIHREYSQRTGEYGEYDDGSYRTPPPPPPAQPGLRVRLDQVPMARRLIDAGYKSLARLLHPDHAGGDAEEMRDLNLLVDQLRAQLATLK